MDVSEHLRPPTSSIPGGAVARVRPPMPKRAPSAQPIIGSDFCGTSGRLDRQSDQFSKRPHSKRRRRRKRYSPLQSMDRDGIVERRQFRRMRRELPSSPCRGHGAPRRSPRHERQMPRPASTQAGRHHAQPTVRASPQALAASLPLIVKSAATLSSLSFAAPHQITLPALARQAQPRHR